MGQLTVATFNTHWGVHRSGRAFDVVHPALALAADVLVLQEVWRPNGGPCFVDAIAEGMGGSVHEAVFMSDHNPARPRQLRPPPGAPGTCGISVISRLPVRHVSEIELPHAQGDVVKHRRSLLVTVVGRRPDRDRRRDARVSPAVGIASPGPAGRSGTGRDREPERARRRPEHVGPGRRPGPSEPHARGARPHLARAPSAQPDRPPLDRRQLQGARQWRRGARPSRTTGPSGPGSRWSRAIREDDEPRLR